MRGRAAAAFIAVGLTHLALMLVIAMGLRPPAPPMAAEVAVAPVYLTRLEPRRPRPEPARTRPPAPRPVLARPAETAPGSPEPVIQPPAPASAQAEEEGRRVAVARALRARSGCATPELLSPDERRRCEDRLAEGARTAKYIPTPLPPERRAYYDAIVAAKAPVTAGNIVQGAGAPKAGSASTFGRGGLQSSIIAESGALRGVSGSAPGVGCALAFGGPGGGWRRPPHGLKLGPLPCYVTPPQGPLSVEANIRNPDAAPRGEK